MPQPELADTVPRIPPAALADAALEVFTGATGFCTRCRGTGRLGPVACHPDDPPTPPSPLCPDCAGGGRAVPGVLAG